MAEEFVTIDLSKKQVDTSRLVHNDKTGKDYARVFAPGGGSFLYPIDSIKVKKDDENRVYFTRPVGTEIQVQYSRRNEGVPEDAPKDQRYTNETRTWKIEDLKAAYEEERKHYAEKNSDFVNMMVPTEWGKHVSNEKGEFVSISIPIEKVYYSFLVQADRFKASDRNEGMSYFGFPKHKKDSEEDFTISLRSNVKNEDGEYDNVKRVVTSQDLKKYVDDAVGYANVKDLFVTTVISEKLIQPFTSKEGKELLSVSVPVWNDAEQKDTFYEIVIPAERGKVVEDGRTRRLSLFKNGPDGQPYEFTAKESHRVNDGDSFETTEMKMTSAEVVEHFEKSKERFKDSHQSSDHTLADELKGSNGQEAQQDQSFRRHNGR